MNTILMGAAAAAALTLCAAGARAEPYVDYTPMKGAWQVTEIHVAPAKIDDYLVGLKKTWVPAQEIDKKHGIIDAYEVMVKIDAAGRDANVILTRHLVSLAALDPDKARDTAIENENLKLVPQATGEQMVAGYDKYRTFLHEGFYQSIDFGK